MSWDTRTTEDLKRQVERLQWAADTTPDYRWRKQHLLDKETCEKIIAERSKGEEPIDLDRRDRIQRAWLRIAKGVDFSKGHIWRAPDLKPMSAVPFKTGIVPVTTPADVFTYELKTYQHDRIKEWFVYEVVCEGVTVAEWIGGRLLPHPPQE